MSVNCGQEMCVRGQCRKTGGAAEGQRSQREAASLSDSSEVCLKSTKKRIMNTTAVSFSALDRVAAASSVTKFEHEVAPEF